MFAILRASLVSICMILNLAILSTIYFVALVIGTCIPIPLVQRTMHWLSEQLYHLWVDINAAILHVLLPTTWVTDIPGDLDPQQWYALVSNHASGIDILVLQCIFNRKIPHLKFFMKDSLKWIPFAGQLCYLSNYPMIKRYSPQQIRKNPALRHKNIDSVKVACKRLQQYPTTVINFCEGTRFTPAKKAKTQSPYTHLLAPQAGGTALVLQHLDSKIQRLLDVTIHYPQGATLGDFIQGKVPQITVHCQTITVNEGWRGDFYQDRQFRRSITEKLQQLWTSKDKKLSQLYHPSS